MKARNIVLITIGAWVIAVLCYAYFSIKSILVAHNTDAYFDNWGAQLTFFIILQLPYLFLGLLLLVIGELVFIEYRAGRR